jgi:hypothetical protein
MPNWRKKVCGYAGIWYAGINANKGFKWLITVFAPYVETLHATSLPRTYKNQPIIRTTTYYPQNYNFCIIQ